MTVNRLWQQFFGVGLVKTSENFGSQGETPSHPELLDWLARELIDSGWNIKALQRQILLSSTYRQSSAVTAKLLALDPENRLLARAPRSRLPAFVLRDQALAVSGLLVEKPFGPPTKPYLPPRLWESISNNKYEQDHGEALYRRSLYTFWRRTIPPPLLTTLNAADRETCVVRKDQHEYAAASAYADEQRRLRRGQSLPGGAHPARGRQRAAGANSIWLHADDSPAAVGRRTGGRRRRASSRS